MRHPGLVKELLLGVRAKGHLSVIEALFFNLLIPSVVVGRRLGGVWRSVEPLLRVTFLASFHDGSVL